jgi:hypothetical protein
MPIDDDLERLMDETVDRLHQIRRELHWLETKVDELAELITHTVAGRR